MGQLLADLDLLIRAGDGQSLLICIDSHVLNSLSAGLNHAVYDVVAGPADANDLDGDDIFRTGLGSKGHIRFLPVVSICIGSRRVRALGAVFWRVSLLFVLILSHFISFSLSGQSFFVNNQPGLKCARLSIDRSMVPVSLSVSWETALCSMPNLYSTFSFAPRRTVNRPS